MAPSCQAPEADVRSAIRGFPHGRHSGSEHPTSPLVTPPLPRPELVDAASARLLAPTGWVAPTTGDPTGAQWISSYLAPPADALEDRVRFDSRVAGVSRRGRDRLVDAGRAEQPFTVHVEGADGAQYRIDARAAMGDLDLSYTPPLGSPWDAMQVATQAWSRSPSVVNG